MRNFIFTLAFFSFLTSINAIAQLMDALPRHAYWGASFTLVDKPIPGVSIASTVASGFAESLNLQKGDVIAKVNGLDINTRTRYYEVF